MTGPPAVADSHTPPTQDTMGTMVLEAYPVVAVQFDSPMAPESEPMQEEDESSIQVKPTAIQEVLSQIKCDEEKKVEASPEIRPEEHEVETAESSNSLSQAVKTRRKRQKKSDKLNIIRVDDRSPSPANFINFGAKTTDQVKVIESGQASVTIKSGKKSKKTQSQKKVKGQRSVEERLANTAICDYVRSAEFKQHRW